MLIRGWIFLRVWVQGLGLSRDWGLGIGFESVKIGGNLAIPWNGSAEQPGGGEIECLPRPVGGGQRIHPKNARKRA